MVLGLGLGLEMLRPLVRVRVRPGEHHIIKCAIVWQFRSLILEEGEGEGTNPVH